MSDRTANGFMLSAALHALAVGALFLGYLIGEQTSKAAPKVLELVAGEGDNYTATEAPALGVPGGIKIAIPEPPAPAQPEPIPITPAPIQAAPERTAPPAAKPVEKIPDFARDVKRIATKRQQRLEARDRRIREAQEKKEREAAARKAREEELNKRRMTKADFDKKYGSKSAAPSKSPRPAKVARIDAEGIKAGVIGGSAANRTGGAGGQALTREQGDAIDEYTALLAQKIKTELDEKPGVGAGLIVEVQIRIMADGSITGFRITRSSGSADFDQAVREALGNIKLPRRPVGLSELQRFPIRGVE
jgi:colicin import membrane protein